MSQKLIMPINKCKMTASMKTDAYYNRFGYVHYGVDLISSTGDKMLYASGNGTVVAAGLDNVVGNVVAVRYTDSVHRTTGEAKDVIFRYFHLDSIAVTVGQSVTKDTKLGNYGNTGQLSTGAHLHLEADTDVEHPLYSPTVSSSNLIIGRASGANDLTMYHPIEWLHCKTDAPDNQTYTTAADQYIRAEDRTIAKITAADMQPDDSGNEVVEPPAIAGIEGIDVSVHNGVIDWKQVKAAGKEFVFVRLGWAGWDGLIEGNDGLDKRFHDNVKGAIEAGLHVGVYIYSYCVTPEAAVLAAREVLELVSPYQLTYPIAFDIEDTSDSGVRYDQMGKVENTAIAAAFLGEIQKAGHYSILYTYKSFAENYLDMGSLSDHDLWIAHYANAIGYQGPYSIWQYKGDVSGFVGSCPGVTGACDLNVSYKDYAALCETPGSRTVTVEEAVRILKDAGVSSITLS